MDIFLNKAYQLAPGATSVIAELWLIISTRNVFLSFSVTKALCAGINVLLMLWFLYTHSYIMCHIGYTPVLSLKLFVSSFTCLPITYTNLRTMNMICVVVCSYYSVTVAIIS